MAAPALEPDSEPLGRKGVQLVSQLTKRGDCIAGESLVGDAALQSVASPQVARRTSSSDDDAKFAHSKTPLQKLNYRRLITKTNSSVVGSVR